MSGRGEDLLAGLVALLLVPWIVWTMMRGLREGRLPIARSHVVRAERRGAFHALLGLYGLVLVLVAAIAIDLLFGVRLWNFR
ncbi:hypothetical protein [Sphingosinicella sp.]|uniref:hypothetical protein n=1 Tax=Sphingosinicella sp. TaxID=1917971 RepID=UPI0040384212